MDIVIFCGGRGTRLSEKTKEVPKPLVEIGSFPILWHIMKIFGHYGHNRFLLGLGYKGDLIKRWFLDYRLRRSFELNFKKIKLPQSLEDWKILFKNTGFSSGTATRLKLLKKDIKSKRFIITYGDGLANINIDELIKFHEKQVKENGVIATMSTFQPNSQYGLVEPGKNGLVESFEEKSRIDEWINIGFIVCEKEIFKYIPNKISAMLVKDVFPVLASKKKLAMYEHHGEFYSMDTYKDYQDLNNMWREGIAKWKVWKN